MEEDTLNNLYDWFWSESLWLPQGYTWKDFASTKTVKKAELKDLYVLPFLVVSIFILRYFFERFAAKPFCLLLGIKDRPAFSENSSCERMYLKGVRFPNNTELNILLNETKLSKQQICTWFRRRRSNHRNSRIDKALESCWRLFVYSSLFGYGSYVLLRTDWIWDSSKLLVGYIHEHQFTDELKYYYLAEISFYISLFISQFFDTKRKDALQQFIHHIATLTLLCGSYILSLYRFGAVIMYLHDAADAWLESAKIANYAHLQKICDILFGVFALVFFLTRLVYYPIWVAYAYFHYNENTNSIVHNCLVTLCFVLLFLHFYWGYLIGRMAYKVLVSGNGVKDSRSDTEESENEE